MPHKNATAKENRMYEHVKRSERREGRALKVSKRIAAATVNKFRRRKGQTKSK